MQRTNRYLFHGSDTITDLLSPARAVNRGKKDPTAKVFATEVPEIAVFHALARTVKRTVPNLAHLKHGFSTEDNGLVVLRAEPKLLGDIARSDEITNIYVLEKKRFQRKSDMEWQSLKPVVPLAVVFVCGKDLAGLAGPRVELATPE